MSNSQKILNEIIEISKADITDLIIDEMKFGEILDNIHNQKKSTSLKLDTPKPCNMNNSAIKCEALVSCSSQAK